MHRSPTYAPPFVADESHTRIRTTVAQFVQHALYATNVDDLLGECAALLATTLHADYAVVLEALPDGTALRLRAGVGWDTRVTEHAPISTDSDEQAAYTLRCQTPVVVTDLPSDTRFHHAAFLHDQGVISGLSVVIPGTDRPWGVLSVHTVQHRHFAPTDVDVAQAAASILAMAAQRFHVEQDLRTHEERLTGIVETNADGIVIVDTNGRISFANAAAEHMFGLPRAVMMARPYNDPAWGCTTVDGQPYPDDQLPFAQVMRTGTAVYGVELAVQHADGRRVLLSVNAAPLRDRAGGMVGVVAALRDVTEHKHTQALHDRLVAILEATTDFVGMADQHGHTLYLNRAGRALVGIPADADLSHTTIADAHPAWAKQIIAEQGLPTAQRSGVWTGETALRHRNGQDIPVSQVILAHTNAVGDVEWFSTIARDTSERQRAAAAHHQYTERLRLLHEIDRAILAAESPTAMAEATLERLCALLPCCRASVTLYDLDASEATVLAAYPHGTSQLGSGTRFPLRARPMLEQLQQGEPYVVADLAAALHGSPTLQALYAEGIRSLMQVPLMLHGRLAGSLNIGADRPYALRQEHIEVVREIADQLAVAIQHTQLFEAVRTGHTQLQRLSRRLLDVQEEERRHLARELHDAVGQTLTGLKFTLEMAIRLPQAELQPALTDAQSVVGDLMARVRDLSLDLRPAMLDTLGLLPTLVWHIERYTAQTGIEVHFEHAGVQRRFHAEVETAAYRIVQEALTNVARHAQTSTVSVSLHTDAELLRVQIVDQGCGFNVEQTMRMYDSSGLGSMRERTQLLGGHFALRAAPGAGTVVSAVLPIEAATTHHQRSNVGDNHHASR